VPLNCTPVTSVNKNTLSQSLMPKQKFKCSSVETFWQLWYHLLYIYIHCLKKGSPTLSTRWVSGIFAPEISKIWCFFFKLQLNNNGNVGDLFWDTVQNHNWTIYFSYMQTFVGYVMQWFWCCFCWNRRSGSGHSADIWSVWNDPWSSVGWKHAATAVHYVQRYACC